MSFHGKSVCFACGQPLVRDTFAVWYHDSSFKAEGDVQAYGDDDHAPAPRLEDLKALKAADSHVARMAERIRILNELEADWLETGPWQNFNGFLTHGDPYVRARAIVRGEK
jgi:hypothetical protein